MTRRFLNQSGFTFVELMITLAFISIALLASTSQFPLGLAVSKSAEDLTLGTNLAQELLEEIRTVPWDLIDGIYDGLSENPPQNIENLPMDGQGGRPNYSHYRRDTSIAYADPVTLDTTSVVTALKRIEVSVKNTRTDHKTTLVLIMTDHP